MNKRKIQLTMDEAFDMLAECYLHEPDDVELVLVGEIGKHTIEDIEGDGMTYKVRLTKCEKSTQD